MISVGRHVYPATPARPVRAITVYWLPSRCPVLCTTLKQNPASSCPCCRDDYPYRALRSLRLELRAHWNAACWFRSTPGWSVAGPSSYGGELHLPHAQFPDDNARQVVEAYVEQRLEDLTPICMIGRDPAVRATEPYRGIPPQAPYRIWTLGARGWAVSTVTTPNPCTRKTA